MAGPSGRFKNVFRKALGASAITLVLACSPPFPVMTFAPESDSTKADGQSSIRFVANITKGGAGVTEGNVTFTLDTDGASFAPITDPTKPPPSQNAKETVDVTGGTAEVNVYSVAATRVAVTALYIDTVSRTSGTATASASFAGVPVPVSSFEYLGAEPPDVPLRGNSSVKFKALNGTGNPVASLPVTFSVAPKGMATVEANGTTGSDGTVTTTLIAGNVAGTVTVTVMAANDETVKKTSDSIAIFE